MQLGAHIVLSGIQLVLAGVAIGVLMAAPIGPVNVLVIQRAVARGFWGGLAAGIGAVLADGLLAAIAASASRRSQTSWSPMPTRSNSLAVCS